MPSDYGETNGNVLLEASQFSCSLIASDRVGIHPEIISNQAGLVFDASNKRINVPNLGDHRICMATFILAILTGAKTKIKNFETVFTSSPSFLKTMKFLGVKFEIQ